MEYHADEVSANVAGGKHLGEALMRLDLGSAAYGSIMSFYGEKSKSGQIPDNIYPHHSFATNYFAQQNKIDIIDGFPKVGLDHLNEFKGTKVEIKNQWASHPEVEDRVGRVSAIELDQGKLSSNSPSWNLFSNQEELQKKITGLVFKEVEIKEPAVIFGNEAFNQEFVEDLRKYDFDQVFNGYYYSENPFYDDIEVSLEKAMPIDGIALSDLFSDEMKVTLKNKGRLETDIAILNGINSGDIKTKTFDYEGIKYNKSDAFSLSKRLESDLKVLKDKIEENQNLILAFFINQAKLKDREEDFRRMLLSTKAQNKKIEAIFPELNELSQAVGFLYHELPHEAIEYYNRQLNPIDLAFQNKLVSLMADEDFVRFLDQTQKQVFEDYNQSKWQYYQNQKYNQNAVDKLMAVLEQSHVVLPDVHFLARKELLQYMLDLTKEQI